MQQSQNADQPRAPQGGDAEQTTTTHNASTNKQY